MFTNIVQNTPYKKAGLYKGFSIILFGGSSYDYSTWDRVDKKWVTWATKTLKKSVKEDINFQKDLSTRTETFSFTRPYDLLNVNLYQNKQYKIIKLPNKFFIPKNFAIYVKELLNHHKIRPPYFLYGASEGCDDVMIFAKYYPKLICGVILEDPTGMNGDISLSIEFETLRGNKKWINDLISGKISMKLDWDINSKSKKELKAFDNKLIEKRWYNIFKYRNQLAWSVPFPLMLLMAGTPHARRHEKKEKLIKEKLVKKFQRYNKNNMSFMFLGPDVPHQIHRTEKNLILQIIDNN